MHQEQSASDARRGGSPRPGAGGGQIRHGPTLRGARTAPVPGAVVHRDGRPRGSGARRDGPGRIPAAGGVRT
ncbi:hypothetical protein SBD_4186 [Streptomyces bottropensis ATCC 25435]|uniref:Uncharacterized protein n=1 Tax=Streptomyces bottropensis ATCC 25435 TaxID=1054862 RepID=M3EZ22_9ACTN|nr:hypothetical protein SBD_4186 [Streptomyces bottropensis ATCC 25435]